MNKFSLYPCLLLGLFLSACGSEKSEQDILGEMKDRVVRESAENERRLMMAELQSLAVSKKSELSLIDVAPKNLGEQLCSHIKSKKNASLFTKKALVQFNETDFGKCLHVKIMARTFPTSIIEIEQEAQVKSHVILTFNRAGKIKSWLPLPQMKKKLNVRRDDVAMRDGVNLSVYSFISEDAPFTVYVRSALFQLHTDKYFSIIEQALKNNLNIVVEELRGSRNSQGVMRWFDSLLINDGEDVLKWAKKELEIGNNIITIGQGYDAIAALAVGMGKEKVRSIISCSAPLALGNKYHYDMLKLIGESRGAVEIPRVAEQVNLMRLKGVPLNHIDSLLLGRKVEDFQDFLVDEKSYWRAKKLEGEIYSIKVPTVHVAGLKSDPFAAGLFKTYKKFKGNNKHALYLHKEGTGCGDIMSSRHWLSYASGSLKRPTINRYFWKKKRYMSVPNLKARLKEKKVYFDFVKSDLFSFYPGLASAFGGENISLFSLNDFSHKAQGESEVLSSFYVNGPVSIDVPVASSLGTNEQRDLMVSLKVNEKLSGLGESSVNGHIKRALFESNVASGLWSRGDKLSLEIRAKVPTDFNTTLPKHIGENKMADFVVIPFTDSGKRAYVTFWSEK